MYCFVLTSVRLLKSLDEIQEESAQQQTLAISLPRRQAQVSAQARAINLQRVQLHQHSVACRRLTFRAGWCHVLHPKLRGPRFLSWPYRRLWGSRAYSPYTIHTGLAFFSLLSLLSHQTRVVRIRPGARCWHGLW